MTLQLEALSTSHKLYLHLSLSGHFYNDDSRAFSEVLLYGQEWSLLIFNLFLFMVIDWASNWNIILAAIITYFVDIAIVTIRDTMGKKNLADKTMVDERFLI